MIYTNMWVVLLFIAGMNLSDPNTGELGDDESIRVARSCNCKVSTHSTLYKHLSLFKLGQNGGKSGDSNFVHLL